MIVPRFDVWNNPLVISAWRVRHRRSPLGRELALIVLVWGIVAAAIYRYAPPPERARIFFVAMVSITGAIAAFATMSATQLSIHNEVLNRTLDFQRIAALSPRRLLAGKLFGEGGPAMLHVLATLPLAVGCVPLGVAPLAVVLWLYLSLLTTTVLFGVIGLNHPFEIRTKRPANAGGGQRGGAVGGMIAAAIISAQALFHSGAATSPWLSPIVGLLTPFLAIRDVWFEQPLAARFPLFGLSVPYLWLTPLAQAAVAVWLFGNIARRLVHTAATGISKASAYLAVAVVDIVAASVLYDPPGGYSLAQRAAAFALVHSAASLLLVFPITPGRDLATSWVWRFQEVGPRWRDALLGDRSPNAAAALALLVLGAASAALFVLLPTALHGQAAQAARLGPRLADMAVACGLTLFALAQLLQWCYLRGEKSFGGITFIVLAVLLDVPAHIAGDYFRLPWIAGLAPSAHFARWLSDEPSLPLAPLIALYAAVALASWLGIARWIRRTRDNVDRKLRAMGVATTG